MRTALLRDGARMIESLLNTPELLPADPPVRPHETTHRHRKHRLQTLFGLIVFKRSYYHHRRAKCGRCPLDETLDLVRGHTPAVAKLIARAATQSSSFEEAAADLRAYGGLELDSRGFGAARQVVYLGDGAAWVWENARLNFPGAEQILDFYHASEHLGTLAQSISGQSAKDLQARWCHQLKASDSSAIVAQAQAALQSADADKLSPEQREAAQREIDYFKTHAQRTRYGDYRRRGLFIGSGVVEAGCKTVIGRRLKQSGMFWSQRGGEDILSLRCLILGQRFDETWNARLPILTKQRNKARRWSPINN